MTGRRYHHGELRGALLDAAENLVREQGIVGWSLREASARVGVSPSAAYHHFASRDALVHALSARVLARLGERMGEAAAREAEAAQGTDPRRGLVAAGRAYVRWAVEDPAIARLAFGFGAGGAETAISPHPHDVLDAELDRLADGGHLTPGARPGADFVVWAAVHGLATLLADGLMTLDGPDAVDLETERVVRAVIGGLAREETPAGNRSAAGSAHTARRERDHRGELPAADGAGAV